MSYDFGVNVSFGLPAQPVIHEIHKIPDTLNVAPVILAGKVDLIVFIGSLPHRPAATLSSI
jgi:hypothetical protein